MEYYEVAAKWWGDELRKKEKVNMNEINVRRIRNFESILAGRIKDLVEKNDSLLISYEDTEDNIINRIARRVGIYTSLLPKNINMIIRTCSVTIYSDYQMKYKTIFREKQ